MDEYEIVGAGVPVSINKEYRILFPYDGKFCKVMIFCIAKDGSINFSPYVKDANQTALQKVNPDKKGNIHVEYEVGDITYKEYLKSNNILKVNYHAS